MMRVSVLVVLVLASAAGCATPFKKAPTAEQLAEASRLDRYGPPPEQHEALVNAHLKATLFDPYSVQDLRIGPLERTYVFRSGGLLVNEGTWWGWRCPVTLNAKNRYGAYTGIRTEYLYFHGADVLDEATVRSATWK